jgi:hypothetical protein
MVSGRQRQPRNAALIFARASAVTSCPIFAALIFARVSADRGWLTCRLQVHPGWHFATVPPF